MGSKFSHRAPPTVRTCGCLVRGLEGPAVRQRDLLQRPIHRAVVSSPRQAEAVARQVNAGSGRGCSLYHFFVEGSCTVISSTACRRFTCSAGDIILFPHGDAHTMASSERAGRPAARRAGAAAREARGAAIRRRRRADALHLRLSVVRSHPVPAYPGGAAQGGDGQPARQKRPTGWSARFVYAVAEALHAARWRRRAGQAVRGAGGRDVAPLHLPDARGPDRLARGLARSRRRQVPRADAREAGASLDARKPGARGGHLALGARREVHPLRRAVAHAVSRQVAHGAGVEPAAAQRLEHDADRAGSRL